MGRKISRREIDEQLLRAIFTLEDERKYIQSIAENSIDATGDVYRKEKLAEVKYLFLLGEARHREMRAIRY